MSLSDYVIHQLLGKGTFGQVYLAEGPTGYVALKIIDPRYVSRETPLIYKEYELGQRINNICNQTVPYKKIFMTRLAKGGIFPPEWTEKNCLVIVMTYLTGYSMSRYVQHYTKHRQNVPPTTCLNYLIQTGRIVQQLHRHNFVHGDLNLGNVFLSNGHYYLIDLGGAADLSVTDPRRADGFRLDKVITGPVYMVPALISLLAHPETSTPELMANCAKSNDVYSLIVSGLILMCPRLIMDDGVVILSRHNDVPKMFDSYRRINMNLPLTDQFLSLLISWYQRFHVDYTFYLSIDDFVDRLSSLV